MPICVLSQYESRFNSAIDSWKKALSSLLKENLNCDEHRRKVEYQAQLSGIKKQRRGELEEIVMTLGPPVNLADTSAIPEDIRDMPWVRAMMMMPELVSRKNEMRKSSVSVLANFTMYGR
jgi:hypothetical protein